MCEVIPLFGSLEENADILEKRSDRIAAIASSDDNHIRFKILGTDEYIALDKTTIYYKIRILKEDGTNIGADSQIALINYIGATCFEKLEVSLGVGQDNVIILEHYNYTAFLETQLTYNDDYQKTSLSCGNFYADTPGKLDTRDDTNLGFNKRKMLTANSAYTEVESRLHSGIFNQQKPLKSRVSMSLEFTVSRPEFVLMAPAND